jgi:hypothetical protein
MTLDITEFLLARIAEDEAEAKPMAALEDDDRGGWAIAYAERVLAECAAKRAIIAEHEWRTVSGETGCGLCNYYRDYGWEEVGPCKTIRALAAVYKDHPDYTELVTKASGTN